MKKRKKKLPNSRSSRTAKRRAARARKTQRLNFEALEKRQLLATFSVNTPLDEFYDGGTLVDETNDGDGLSLREAIGLANTDSAMDLIEFDVSLSGSTISLASPRMTISEDVTIDGDNDNDGQSDITIDGVQSTALTRQHFEITGGTTTLYGLNLTRGRGQGSNNGGIDVRAGATLNFYNSQLVDAFTFSGVAGIDNAGTTNIRNSQINRNHNYVYGNGTSGIRNQAGATLSVVNSSLTDNSFRGNAGYTAQQAGIVNYGNAQLVNVTIADGHSLFGHIGFNNKSGATATLTHTTITGNQSGPGPQTAGIRNESGATLTLTNSLVTGNRDGTATPANLNNQGTLNLVGGNIIGDEYSVDGVVQSSGFEPGDVIDGPAADNGGFVKTVLLTGSLTNPALEAATVLTETAVGLDVDGDGVIESTPISIDARGLSRDVDIDGSGSTPDLGALELQSLPPVFLGDLSDGTEAVKVLENTASTTDSPAGTVVIDVDANDGDGGGTDAGLTFAFVSGNDDPDADGTSAFSIDSSTGEITVNDETDLNLHRQSSFTLLVRITDTGVDHITSTATVVVDIADVSESYVVVSDTLESYDGGTLEDETADGSGLSLSEAIGLANAGSAADLIEFDVSLLSSTISLTSTRMTISEDLTIDGDIDNDGLADITIDGAVSSAVTRQHFEIAGGTTTLNGLNLTQGRGQGNNNGGIDVRAGATLNFYNSQLVEAFSYSGVAGIDNAGTTNIRNSQINGNFNYVYGNGTSGIRNQAGATLSVVNSSLTDNSFRGNAGYTAQQAGIVNYGNAQLVNVTIADGHSLFGHIGFNNKSGATATLTHTTITGNQSGPGPQTAGIRNESGATLTLTNSLVTGNRDGTATPANLNNQGTLNLVGGNIIGDEYSVDGVVKSSGFDPSDVIDGPAADNGGFVKTVALTLTSSNPAIDAADDSAAISTDARELARVDNPEITNNGSNIADLGAYEAAEPGSLFVTTDLDVVDTHDGLTSLREALQLANDPSAGDAEDGDADNDGNSVDHITFDPSLTGATLTLTQGTLWIRSDVSVNGDLNADNSPDITIDANGNSRVLTIDAGTSELRGLSLTGGNEDSGGGIYLTGSGSLTLADSLIANNSAGERGGGIMAFTEVHLLNSQVTNNSAQYGGGIFSVRGILTLTNSTIANNSAERTGGGLSASQATRIEITNSSVLGNVVTNRIGSGGGVHISYTSGTVAIDNSIIANNAASGTSAEGGGLVLAKVSSATITDTMILENTAGGNGGGLYVNGGAGATSVSLAGSIVNDNSAGGDGGGIALHIGNLTISSSTLSGNVAGGNGGGLRSFSGSQGPSTVTNTTIVGNRTDGSGGGIYNISANSPMSLSGSTVTGNYATSVGGVYDLDLSGETSISNSIIAGNSDVDSQTDPTANPDLIGSEGLGAGTNLIGHGSSYSVADIFAEVDADTGGGLLADNGGQVPTVALKVSFDNPAYNTADSALIPADTLDLDGDGDTTEPIPFDGRGPGFARNNGGFADLGAYELPSALIVTTDQDVVDATDGLLSLREALELANDPAAGAAEDGDADNDGSSVDHITFHPSLEGSTLTLTQGILLIDSDVSVDGDIDGEGAPGITVDGAGNSGILFVDSGTSQLRGLTLTGGASFYGPGIQLENDASLTLISSQVTNNIAQGRGGGIHVRPYAQLHVVDSSISNNTSGRGGGIFNSGTLTVAGSTISNNLGGSQGGGIASYGVSGFPNPSTYIRDSVISDNNGGRGGGVFFRGSATLSGVQILNNTGSRGAGIYSGGELHLSGSTLSGNTASGYGGGLNHDRGSLFVTNTTIEGNRADAAAGIQFRATATGSITSSTITGNYATGYTGGILSLGANSFSISNSIVAGNSHPASVPSFVDPDLWGNEGSGAGTNLIGQDSPYTVDDIFAEVDPVTGGGLLADNGGQVLTVALKASSDNPVFNTADPAFLPADTLDLDGDGDTTEPIPFDARGPGFARNIGGFADLGAYELPLVFISPDTADVPENTQPVVTLTAVADETRDVDFRIFGDAPADELGPGQTLQVGEFIESPDGMARLIMQGDGNLVVYISGVPTWASATHPAANASTTVQSDGNLVITDGDGTVIYQSNSGGNTGAYARLRVDNAGFPEIVRIDGEILWQGTLNRFGGQGTVFTPDSLAPEFIQAADTDLFEIINGDQLRFIAPPDFENPTDADGDNVYEVTVLVDDGNGNVVPQTLRVTVTDVTEIPTVESVVIDNGDAQRSMVRSLTVTFDTVVAIDSGAFSLANATTGNNFTISNDDVTISVVNGKTVAVLTFTNSTNGLLGNSLVDGRYTLKIEANKIRVGADMMATDHIDEFFRLFGDSDGDGDVDRIDYARFQRAYGQAPGDSFYNDAFDVDGDGDIDRRDFAFFRRNYRKSL